MKKKTYSPYHDFHTGFLWKILLILGVILLAVSIEEFTIALLGLAESVTGSLLAFAILALGAAGLLFFFSRQFSKLAQIAKEIEEEE